MSRAPTASISSLSPDFGIEPGWEYTQVPSRKAITVGTDAMFAAAASSCSASVFTVPNTTPGCSREASSKIGPNARQGPHHGAQKSTNTML